MPTKFGITYEVVDVDNPGTFTINANGSDTTIEAVLTCLLYTSHIPRDLGKSRIPYSD